MPFFRSSVATSGGGGSYNKEYIAFIGSDTKFAPNYQPLMNMGQGWHSFSFNNFNAKMNEITEIKIGKRVLSLSNSFWNTNINAVFNMYNATFLFSTYYTLAQCNNFNSPVIFPNNTSLTYTRFPGGTQFFQNYPSFSYMFSNCRNYNQPTTVRFHEISTPDNKMITINMSGMFSGCNNFNSRLVFDFDRLYKNTTNLSLARVLYSCSSLFFFMAGSYSNFNQPMVFKGGLQNADRVFCNCPYFNQPVVFDVGFASGTPNLSSAFNCLNMKSDIIILNGNHAMNVNNFLRSGRNNASINIYTENISKFQSASNLFNNRSSLTWTSVTNGVYNEMYNVYLLNNVSDGLNAFNEYYYNFYGEYPIYD